MPKLSASLVLYKFMLHQFGVTDLEALSQDLKDSSLEGYDENNISLFHHELARKFYANEHLPADLLLKYDLNIYSYTRAISEKRVAPIRWKYFQYLSLLFTEIYLDKYFTDSEALQEALNSFLQLQDGNYGNDFGAVSSYKIDNDNSDLNKLAYWNATGSGKTLLMHVNILQYKHYLQIHGRGKELNKIIVLTPNEGLSLQHLGEFASSGMEAELFDKSGGLLFAGQKIEIIDIHKLEDVSGAKTVAVDSFEGNNLVLVDEGHRGSGGTTWKDYRNRLCASGFSFEYSATFGQAVHALSGRKQKDLLDEYGKATLFDYSYRYFYKDGYGKDYQILNLDEQWHTAGREDTVTLYLTASLLAFYEQLLVFRNNSKEIDAFLIDKPLAIFVGGKVTKSINTATASDVVEVLLFLSAFVGKEQATIARIKLLLENRDGLNNAFGQSIFRNAFKEIRKLGLTAEEVYNDLLKELFNAEVAGAMLHLDNLKGQDGEIGLRMGNAEYFGVINVGDDRKLLKICEEHNLLVDEKDFSTSLFRDINNKDSKINVLIGSKKFSEGWSSWRVSTMGLLNIGRGEGSEIIQLFGRGVRLKGYQFSLKRSSALDASLRPENIPAVLPILETLNIFGLRADYMQQFRDYLEEEGLPTESDFETIVIPTIFSLPNNKLKYIKVKEGSNFKRDVIVDAVINDAGVHTILDWYPRVQVLRSATVQGGTEIGNIEEGKLEDLQLAFLDYNTLYFDLQKYKNERSWYNLNLSKEALQDILSESSWYTLHIPRSELIVSDYGKVNLWQELALALLKSFVERLYNKHKNKFFNDNSEVAILDTSHPNFEKEYKFILKNSEESLISQIKKLEEQVRLKIFAQNFPIGNDFNALYAGIHLYQPLIYMDNGRYKEVVKLQPVALNKGENDFVEDLKRFFDTTPAFFEDKQLYLLRNKSKKGIGFFESNHFFPDFIMWLVLGNKQYVSFIDPKGLRQVQGLSDPKIQLHKSIKENTQRKLNDPHIELSSFIISNTPYKDVRHWRGQDNIEDFNLVNVYFQPDQRMYYVNHILSNLIV